MDDGLAGISAQLAVENLIFEKKAFHCVKLIDLAACGHEKCLARALCFFM